MLRNLQQYKEKTKKKLVDQSRNRSTRNAISEEEEFDDRDLERMEQ